MYLLSRKNVERGGILGYIILEALIEELGKILTTRCKARLLKNSSTKGALDFLTNSVEFVFDVKKAFQKYLNASSVLVNLASIQLCNH